jgi:hypothetical protein
MTLTISITPRRIAWILAFIVIGLTFASFLVLLFNFVAHESLVGTETLVEAFSLNSEQNLPTWFASASLLVCSVLIYVIALAKKSMGDSYARHWTALSAIFLLLSLDETARYHELSAKVIKRFLVLSGPLQSGWVIPASVAVLVFLVAYLKFLAHLPSRTRWMFIASWGLLFGGSIGIEIVGDYFQFVVFGSRNLAVNMISTLEECLELMGMVVFIYALTSYIKSHLEEVKFSFV